MEETTRENQDNNGKIVLRYIVIKLTC